MNGWCDQLFGHAQAEPGGFSDETHKAFGADNGLEQAVDKTVGAWRVGGEGYRVWVARFGSKENQEALVQISGIDHKLDGRVIRAKVVPNAGGGSVKYTTTLDGQSYELLSVEGTKAVLRVTGAPWTSDLCYDKSLVDDRSPQHLLTDYLDGQQQKK
jgi:hypothetical protein